MATFSASILSAKRQNKSTTEYSRMSSKNFTWEHLLQLGLMENLLTTQPPKANSMLIPSDYVWFMYLTSINKYFCLMYLYNLNNQTWKHYQGQSKINIFNLPSFSKKRFKCFSSLKNKEFGYIYIKQNCR